MGAPSLGELRLYASAELLRCGVNLQSGFNGDANAQMQGLNLKREESNGENKNVKFSQSGDLSQQILLSERATACFMFSDDSLFWHLPSG